MDFRKERETANFCFVIFMCCALIILGVTLLDQGLCAMSALTSSFNDALSIIGGIN